MPKNRLLVAIFVWILVSVINITACSLVTLDQSEPQIFVAQLDDILASGDLKRFERLLPSQVSIGIYRSDGVRRVPKDDFLDELQPRLSSKPSCIAYTPKVVYGTSTSSYGVFYILTDQWMPGWDFAGKGSYSSLVFEVREEYEGSSALWRIVGAYVPGTIEALDPTPPIPCREGAPD